MGLAPTPGRVQGAGADEKTVTMSLDSDEFVFYPNLLTAKDRAAIRSQAGMSINALLELGQTDPDLDVIAALIWIARCQAGETISLDSVAEAITPNSKIDLIASDAPLAVDHPLP